MVDVIKTTLKPQVHLGQLVLILNSKYFLVKPQVRLEQLVSKI